MREREQLSAGEKDYISNRLTGWKVVSFFLPGLGQIWSKRRGLWWGGLCIGLGLGLLGYASGDSDTMNGAASLSWLINVILTLVKFSEKAYKHDMPYFQKYLNDYAELYGGTTQEEPEFEQEKEKSEKEISAFQTDSPKFVCAKCKGDISIDDKECPHCGRLLENNNESDLDVKHPSKSKYDKYGFDKDGYNRQGYDAYGFDRDGFNRQGYNEEGYDKDGFDKNGYNYKGFDKDGYDKDGYNKRGFDRNGLDKDRYDEYGDKKDGVKKSTRKKNSTVLNGKPKK